MSVAPDTQETRRKATNVCALTGSTKTDGRLDRRLLALLTDGQHVVATMTILLLSLSRLLQGHPPNPTREVSGDLVPADQQIIVDSCPPPTHANAKMAIRFPIQA